MSASPISGSSAWQRAATIVRVAWRWLRAPFWIATGVLLGFGVPYAWRLDALVRERFAALEFTEPSRVYARPLPLAPGQPLTPAALAQELAASRYVEDADVLRPGTWRQDGSRYTIATRAYDGPDGAVPARRVTVTLAGGRVRSVVSADDGRPVADATLDPARIATLHGARQAERRSVRAEEVPPLLVATLQAVEDRDFKHHRGVDPSAILRAAWANLVAGEVVQGGSTLTQQLVRNLFLDRSQTLARKANEALLAVLIEARFDKRRILEAYLNEVYLGQQGGQAVHGVAAGAEFWFGRSLDALSVQDIALLVGMVQGPSYYDPRRHPERALARRALVLRAMETTGLINATDRAVAERAPLAVAVVGALPRNRYPAFLDLVRRQLAAEFPDARLRATGLSIHTTLAPSAQEFAEDAVAERLAELGERGRGLEAAMVLTRAADGAVEAVVGGRDAAQPGFNRALDARRPVGSLVKPFVYLVALAQPERWSLASRLEDRAIRLRQAGGRDWEPANVDGVEHGDVTLIDALARSYNLATVRLGLEVEVGKVARVLEALIPGASIEPLPSVLLGAVDLSPFQVAQAYQYLAADGHPTPLYAVTGVLDADGRRLARHVPAPTAGDLVAAARLVSFALQDTARRGTAHALVGLGLADLAAAGKTGTSNDQRDSWFAGYTGGHLAVVWLGSDDNRQTGLYGSTGAMRVWAGLFGRLPTQPLALDFSEDPRLAWVDPAGGYATDPGCDGARQLPFIRGYEPWEHRGCGPDTLGEFLRSRLGGRWSDEEDDRNAETWGYSDGRED
jgi:penicillin-binding protein 1B